MAPAKHTSPAHPVLPADSSTAGPTERDEPATTPSKSVTAASASTTKNIAATNQPDITDSTTTPSKQSTSNNQAPGSSQAPYFGSPFSFGLSPSPNHSAAGLSPPPHYFMQPGMSPPPYKGSGTPGSMSRRGGKSPGMSPFKVGSMGTSPYHPPPPHHHHHHAYPQHPYNPAAMMSMPPTTTTPLKYHKFFSPSHITDAQKEAQRIHNQQQTQLIAASYMAKDSAAAAAADDDDGDAPTTTGRETKSQPPPQATAKDNTATTTADNQKATPATSSSAADNSSMQPSGIPPPPYPYHIAAAYPPMNLWNMHHYEQQQRQHIHYANQHQQQRNHRPFPIPTLHGSGNNSRPKNTKKTLMEQSSAMAQNKKLQNATSKDKLSNNAATMTQADMEAARKLLVQQTGCTCKRSRCLKLYCTCFAAKLYCGDNCRCLTCQNTSEHEGARQEAMRMILQRNPTAFDTKFQQENAIVAAVPQQHQQAQQQQQQPPPSQPQQAPPQMPGSIQSAASTDSASTMNEHSHGAVDGSAPKLLAHKNGCKCRKSGCMKKYCECYAAGVKCSNACRCMGCKNMATSFSDHGKGDGAAPIVTQKQDILIMPQPYYQQVLPYGMPHPHHHHHPPLHPMMFRHHPPAMQPTTEALNSSPQSQTDSLSNVNGPGVDAMVTANNQQEESKEQAQPGSGGVAEPWLAAHNLAFMKQGTPSPPKKDAHSSELKELARQEREINSVPSLEASSSGEATSPTQDGEGAGVNSLLMAAMAMTGDYDIESSSLSTPLSLLKRRKPTDTSTSGASPKRLRLESPTRRGRSASAKNPLLSPIVSCQHHDAEV